MNKEQSIILKGIAVLFMVWGHLFGRNTDLYSDVFYIFGKPFAQFICGGMSPVAFFLMIGGYGLYNVYLKGYDKNRYKRIFRLYLHYWIVLIIFVPIGYFFVNEERYPGSFYDVILNLIGLSTSYNSECWFLLPYSLVSLSSAFLFRIYDRFNAKTLIAITFSIHLLTCTALHFYGETFINHNVWISLPLVFLHFQLSFSLGALLKREQIFEKTKHFVKERNIKTYQTLLLLLFVFLLMCSVWNTGYYSFYVMFFILSISLLPMENIIGKTLAYIGKHSMNIWMTHTFFAYHLFKTYTYSLKFPVIIFLATIAVSLLSSSIINFIVSFLKRHTFLPIT
ncbi:MAG: acyltransferase [Bacteroidaceae bacterium]|nr:acyltransferase [Bacteroidaceae bacterium]